MAEREVGRISLLLWWEIKIGPNECLFVGH